jgi:hypothetical protein
VHAWVRFEKDENLVETIQASKVVYAKPFKVGGGGGGLAELVVLILYVT